MKNKNYSEQIEKVKIKDFLLNSLLQQQIWDVVSPSYENVTSVLERDINNCSDLYFIRENHKQLQAFLMVGWDKLTTKAHIIPTVYLGLGATSVETKNSGLIKLLFNRFFEDARQWEIENQQKLLLWHTTASPSIFHIFNLLLDYNEPFSDGNYTQMGKEIALAICQKKGWMQHLSMHPFVLHGVAHNTLYSYEEYIRLQDICRRKNFTLFSELDIDERKGDRLLRISCLAANESEVA